KGDELIDVQVTDGKNDVVLATRQGMSIRFHEQDVRDMGRTATGVWGIALDKKDKVIDLVIIRRASTLLTVTEKGMGKRSETDEYRVQHRGGRRIITLKRNDKTRDVVALKEVLPDDELMMITKKGIVIRVPVEGIRISGRNTQGVKVMNLTPGDLVVDVARIVKEDDETGDEDEEAPAPKGAAPKAPPTGAPRPAPPTAHGETAQGKGQEKQRPGARAPGAASPRRPAAAVRGRPRFARRGRPGAGLTCRARRRMGPLKIAAPSKGTGRLAPTPAPGASSP